ncbi:MAG: GNAT family N-acetyltransferase [Candidatus Hodarchaeales archaeon]
MRYFKGLKEIFLESIILHGRIEPIFTSIQGADQIWIDYIDRIYQQENFKVYIAISDEVVVGFCVGEILNKPPVFKVRVIGQVNNLAVKNGFKHQGIGSLLFEKMKQWFLSQKVMIIELSAATNNSEALGFWQKMGGREFMKRMSIDI